MVPSMRNNSRRATFPGTREPCDALIKSSSRLVMTYGTIVT